MKKLVSFLLITALVLSFMPFSAFAVEITGISYATADEDSYTFYEGENSESRFDETSGSSYYYYIINFNVGDTLTVLYSDNSQKDYVAEFIEGELYFVNGDERLKQWEDVSRFENQQSEHWSVGGTYTFYVEYAGFRAPVTAEILENPVDSISYTPRDGFITRYFETGGYFDIDADAHEYYRYNVHQRSTGDILTVNYNDGRGGVDYVMTFDPQPMYVSTVDENDIIPQDEVQMFDEQYRTPYSLGDDNYLYVEYMGKRAGIQVKIVENPISEIVYTPISNFEIYEYTNGDWDVDGDGQEFFRYNTPWFNEGDQLAVTYSDTGNTVVYTYLEYYDSEQEIDYNGFYDSDYNELPNSDDELFTSYDGIWELGDGNFMYVRYMDNVSNQIRVTIKENPVKAIRFERATDVTIVENTHMYYDYWDDREYYSIPYHRTGDKLIVIDNSDNETVYDYQINGVYTSEGQEDIAAFDVRITTDQRDNPWGLGEHEYTVEYFGREYRLPVTIIENPVKSIQYISVNSYEFFENTHGYYDDEYEYYNYGYGWWETGDKLIVTNKDNTVKEYTCTEIEYDRYIDSVFVADDGSEIDRDDISFNDDQETNHWHIGNDNVIYVEYLGARCEIYATVKENPIKAIRFEPVVEPTVMVGVRSFIDDYSGCEIFDLPQFATGDKLIVIDKNNKEKVYNAINDHGYCMFVTDDGEELDWQYLDRNSDQWENPWTLGPGNEYTVEYMGVSCTVTCTVLDNPVESIEFVPKEITRYMEGTNGWYDEMDDCFYYALPRVNEGDVLIVYYRDPLRNRVEYEAVFDRENDVMTFVSSDGEVITEDYRFDFYEDQYQDPWYVGEHHYSVSFCGKSTQVLIVITENNIAGITYTPASMPQVWESDFEQEIDEETGREYKHYNIPDFREGDVLTIHYKDDSSEDFVLTFDENDGERYFVSATGKYHEYTLQRFDKQYESEWALGGGNCYYVDFYGFTSEVEVEIINTDVESVSFTPAKDIILEENKDGEYMYDDSGNKFYCYTRVRIINPGDTLTVKYKNGDEVTYVIYEDTVNDRWGLKADDGSELNTQEVSIDDHQWQQHWRVGRNYFDIKYHGVSDTVPVTIKGSYIPGDINGDGEVDNKDLTRLFQYLSNWEVDVNETALDVNGDGSVDNKDLTRLFQYLSNWDVEIH